MSLENAYRQAMQFQEQGADIIDIGGESTRPGATAVSTQEELNRVVPIIEKIRRQSSVTISVDTSKPEVMKAAVEAGANIINDVRALQEDRALEVASRLGVTVCLMHMQGQPRTMQQKPIYHDVVGEVQHFLMERVSQCLSEGISKHQIWIDPGFGFGKTLQHNLSLLKHLDVFVKSGLPVLVGLSRKSMLGAILNVEPNERLVGSLALAAMAIINGASIIRVHDVLETVQVKKVIEAIESAE